MGIQDIIEGKKQWRAHMARVKALPPDYQIVYKEIQRYLFKVGPVDVLTGACSQGLSISSRRAPRPARESWNSSATTSLPSATTWSRLAHLRGHPPGARQRGTPHGREVTPSTQGTSGRLGRQGVPAEPVRVSPDTPGELSSFSARRQIHA